MAEHEHEQMSDEQDVPPPAPEADEAEAPEVEAAADEADEAPPAAEAAAQADEVDETPEAGEAPEAAPTPEPEPEPVPDDAINVMQLQRAVHELIEARRHDEALGLLEKLAEGADATRQLTDNLWLYRKLGELYWAFERPDEALAAYAHAHELDPRQLDIQRPYIELLFQAGRLGDALEIIKTMLLHHKRSLNTEELLSTYLVVGQCYEQLKDPEQAKKAFFKALEQNPRDTQALAGLLRIMSAHSDPVEIIKIRQNYIRSLDDPQKRSMALVALGDDWLERFNDPFRALDTYERALLEHEANRLALERIATIAREIEDWRRVSRAYFTLSRVAEDVSQEAEWLIKASLVARDQLWEPEKALAGFKRALELDPSRLDAFRIVTALQVDAQDWEGLEQSYAQLIQSNQERDQKGPHMAQLWQNLGDLYREHLDRPDDAILAYDQATLHTDAPELRLQIVELAERNPSHYDTALGQLHALRRAHPDRIDLLERMAKVYLRKKDGDLAYCVYRVLDYAGVDLDEKPRKFIARMQRATYHAPARPLTYELVKRHVFSEHLDRRMCDVFALLKGALEEWTGQDKTRKYGLKRKDRVELTEALAFNTIYRSVGKLLSYPELPEIWRKDDQRGLVNGALLPPGFLVGQELLQNTNEKHLAFIIAKQLFLFLGPFYLAVIRPMTDLQWFLMLALKLGKPSQFDFALEDQAVQELFKVIQRGIKGDDMVRLERVVEVLSQRDDIDVARFVEAVEDTANRVGFIFCDDLAAAEHALQHEAQPISQRPVAERMASLTQYALSEPYFELRETLGISSS